MPKPIIPKDEPTLPQRMRALADKGSWCADELRTAADAFEQASNEFHADRERADRAFELAWQNIVTPEAAHLVNLMLEANRVYLKATTPRPGTVASWGEK